MNSENLERKIVDVNGLKMSYIQLGDPTSKKSIVIIHGSTFNALGMVPYGRLYANKGYNVVLVDTPGHYGDLAQSKSVFSELTDSVAEFMKVLIKEGKLNSKSIVQGWSLGGSIAYDIAIRYGDIVECIGSVDGSSNWNNLDLGHITDYDNKIEALTAFLNNLKSSNVSQEVVDRLASELPLTTASPEACNNDFAIDKVLNVDSGLPHINIPVYAFYGSVDTLTTLEKQKEIMSNLKHGKLFVGEGYGHMAVIEDPEYVFNAFNEMMLE
ncbi:alpha/beta fold hydrolase [Inconstantimicrobium mannanitabidum]|uniref:Alpha/beta hydrolase n=1 Tax=Inconstantimicrobium mannanitabidum TaxID=1604901 RepID=A0ACB5RGN9_9CLOT|nr:alpha/beta hydrolase [Clostridium sp. TW13]GKX68241.1 alpha/beta hydrolase [Clostridium sp. TW13]